MSKGKNRDWGYASYNVDDEEDENLSYTSYEKDGSVNRYHDNGDGGHSHSRWEDKDDYNNGEDRDWGRDESNKSRNPSTGDVQENGGCYLTTACMKHFKEKFDDNCYELTVLRWFRDNFVSINDVNHYYAVAPNIVEKINQDTESDKIYDYIYDTIVDECVRAIENGEYSFAYNRYKESILNLENSFVKSKVLVKTI